MQPATYPMIYLVLLVLPRLLYWILVALRFVCKYIFLAIGIVVLVGVGLPTYIVKTFTNKCGLIIRK
jgi:hypothetical protein